NNNPLEGQEGWTGAGDQWGRSLIDLAAFAVGGDSIQIRFDFGKDFCSGVTGWFVDDVHVYSCTDCDGDLLSDRRNFVYSASSSVLGAIGVGVPRTFSVFTPPTAVGDVAFHVSVSADLASTNEYLDVSLNGTSIGRVFETGAADCSTTPNTETLVLSADAFNNAVNGGDALIRLDASGAVGAEVCDLISGPAASGMISMFLEYPLAIDDCNTNLLQDACEVDCDANGLPDDCDLLAAAPDCNTNLLLDACESDSDGDSFIDACEECPEDPTKSEPGVCGCGAPDADGDGDGVLNCLDACPQDTAKTAPGVCGCGEPDTDRDGDGTPDCADLCPDDPVRTAPGLCGCGLPLAECLALYGCPNDVIITATSPSGAVLQYGLPLGIDPAANVAVVASPPPGSLFPVGDSLVSMTITDLDTAESIRCEFTVTIRPLPVGAVAGDPFEPVDVPLPPSNPLFCALFGPIGLAANAVFVAAGITAIGRRLRRRRS
ncbi:MAG: HYR domain-containing protein, partial [Phycisphaerae bacterium]